ncbi:MAG: hypothetical protein H8E37_02590 [Planctomycetes bacterium]|nr:hypothetical protein [Planctomycetota bacterium]
MLNFLRFALRAKALRSTLPHAATIAFAAAVGMVALPEQALAETPAGVPGSLEMDPEAPTSGVASGEFENDPLGPPGGGMELPPIFDSLSWLLIDGTVYVTGQVTSLTGGDTVEFGGDASGSATVDSEGFFNFSFSFTGSTGYFTAVATDLNGVESDLIIEVI